MTFIQFMYVSVVGLAVYLKRDPDTGHFYLHRKGNTPWRVYITMTALYFLTSVLNNWSFTFGVSQPFNLVARSSQLLASLVIGYLFFSRKYSRMQIGAVALVSFGIIVTTLSEIYSKQVMNNSCADCDALPTEVFSQVLADTNTINWLIGCAMIISSICILAVLGHYQTDAYKNYDIPAEEGLFYTHLMSLPMFVMLVPDLVNHFFMWNNTPIIWIYLVVNVLTQYLCVKGVHNVNKLLGSVACTLVTTVRKFISLVFSVIYFQNPFTVAHWVGSISVFLGAFLYIYARRELKLKKIKEQ
eukprot:TRINITY_DN5440_c0_g1_i1.p1 TRINITY_DN5440_c0_g1~~TRINITY_DN5440_c0_g1_i1.p1  ORF type:complete len:300 (-),score=37.45 TRINITY_DN5440_c0_g1_i1:63-962(-)